MAAKRTGLWWHVLPRAVAMVLWLPLLLSLPLGVSDPAGGFPPEANVADVHVDVDPQGRLHLVTVVAWEQDGQIGPLTDAVAASVTTPPDLNTRYPVLVSNQGGGSADLSSSDDGTRVAALDLETLLARLEQIGFEHAELCVSTPHFVDSSIRSDVVGLDDGCAELAVTDPVSHLEVVLIPDADQFLKLAIPMVVTVAVWLVVLLLWTRRTKGAAGERPAWPMVASVVVSLAAGFFVYSRAGDTGVGLAWGLEPWQASALSMGLYILVLVPGIVALWPLWERRERRRRQALPPPPQVVAP